MFETIYQHAEISEQPLSATEILTPFVKISSPPIFALPHAFLMFMLTKATTWHSDDHNRCGFIPYCRQVEENSGKDYNALAG